MCGIAGALDLTWSGRPFDPRRLDAMCRALHHRGPDDRGSFFRPGLAIGVQRLALMDPEGGAQPMTRHNLTVAVNGERFDVQHQRAHLTQRGHTFTTRCDTEIWAFAWLEHGLDALLLSNAQFAAAFWDEHRSQLTLARDRYGICPLYTATVDGWLLWASEPKALLASGLISPEIDPHAVDHMLVHMCQSPFHSSFKHIKPLRPGHLIQASPDQKPEQKRWFSVDLAAPPSPPAATPGDLIDALDAHLSTAVQTRMTADAPVATYLSGGVDSALITALAARHSPEPVTAFTLKLDGVGTNEQPLALQSAQALGVHLITETITPAHLTDLFVQAVQAAEAPILDHANVCLLALSKRVAQHGFKAVLTGEGADEAFAGYPWFKLCALPPAARRLSNSALAPLKHLVGGPRAELQGWASDPSLAQYPIFSLLARARDSLYSEAMWGALKDDPHRFTPPWDPDTRQDLPPLSRAQRVDFHLLLPEHLLADKGDRMAMASSVEPRFPYLDNAVMSLAAQAPPEVKLKGLQEKWLLRSVAQRHLPHSAAWRPKHMLRATPLIHGPHRPAWVNELLSPDALRKTGLFDPHRVAALMSARDSRLPSFKAWLLESHLTGVVSTQLLHHLFCGASLCDLPPWTA